MPFATAQLTGASARCTAAFASPPLRLAAVHLARPASIPFSRRSGQTYARAVYDRGSPVLLALLMALSACRRAGEDTPGDAGLPTPTATATASASTPVPAPAPALALPDDTSIPAAEPARAELRRLEDDPALLAQRDALHEHFGTNLAFPLSVQTEPLPGDRRAILVVGGPREAPDPFVLVVDAYGTRPWVKERPLGGIVPGVREMALVRGEEGGVGLSFCDPPGKLAALRKWHADGGVFADYEVLELEGCDALSALYWPGRGHLVAVSGAGEARVARLDEGAQRAWGRSGIRLPWKPAAGAPLTIAVDSEETVILLGLGTPDDRAADPGPPAVLAMRYDASGKALWPAPAAVGRPSGPPQARIVTRQLEPGTLEVVLDAAPSRRAVELTSAGNVIFAPRRR